MAFAFDPQLTNQALSKMGSSYQVDAPAAASPLVTQQAPTAAPPVTQAAPDMTEGVQHEAPAKPEGGWNAGEGMESASQMASASSDKTMKKLGALVGTVASIYTGNAMGAASGVASMKGASK